MCGHEKKNVQVEGMSRYQNKVSEEFQKLDQHLALLLTRVIGDDLSLCEIRQAETPSVNLNL